MKGISPLIATILLIMITITIVTILYAWIDTMVEQKEPETNLTVEAQLPAKDIKVSPSVGSIYVGYPNITTEWAVPNVFTDHCSMSPTFCVATLLMTTHFAQSDLRVGDIVEYESSFSDKTLHRIVYYDEGNDCYILKGDNNPEPDPDCVGFEKIRKKLIGIIYGW